MLVSAILPTRGRREWAQQALECFMAQTYPDKELVILDDSEDMSFPNGVHHDWVFHYRGVRPQSTVDNIPKKRNWCCTVAQGEIIIHFDSDDYSVPTRMAEQVEFLQKSGKAVAGYSDLLIYDTVAEQAYSYKAPKPQFVVGTSLIYRRDWWETRQYNVYKPLGSDTEFAMHAWNAKQLAFESGLGKIVARLHPDTSGKAVKDGMWDSLHGTDKSAPSSLTPVDKNLLPSGFFTRETCSL
jgi:hypothetical protein